MKNCKWCAKPFSPKTNGQLYCPGVCFKEARREADRQRDERIRNLKKSSTCTECPTKFKPTHKQIVTCSKVCQKNREKRLVRERYVPKTKPKGAYKQKLQPPTIEPQRPIAPYLAVPDGGWAAEMRRRIF